MRSNAIKIAIVEDYQVLADMLATVIGNEPDFQVVGVAPTRAACLDLVRRARPDVLLLNVSLPDGDALGVVPEIRQLCPEIHILVLTGHADDVTLRRAIDTGVSGLLAKGLSASELVAAVRQAAEGQTIVSPTLLLELGAHGGPTRGGAEGSPSGSPSSERRSA